MARFLSLAPPPAASPPAASPPLTLRLFWQRLAQSFRLMVGVQDYANYLRHMQLTHPEATPMSERDFHRYCLEARYPAKGGKMGKCPC